MSGPALMPMPHRSYERAVRTRIPSKDDQAWAMALKNIHRPKPCPTLGQSDRNRGTRTGCTELEDRPQHRGQRTGRYLEGATDRSTRSCREEAMKSGHLGNADW